MTEEPELNEIGYPDKPFVATVVLRLGKSRHLWRILLTSDSLDDLLKQIDRCEEWAVNKQEPS